MYLKQGLGEVDQGCTAVTRHHVDMIYRGYVEKGNEANHTGCELCTGDTL